MRSCCARWDAIRRRGIRASSGSRTTSSVITLARPVSARRGDAVYHARLFVRRHAVALGIAAVIALFAAGGIAGVVWQASVAAEARDRAERRFDDVRQLAHSFMFGVHDSIVNVPGTTEARALMVRTAVQYLEGIAREAAGDRVLQRELAGAFVKVGDAQGHPTSPNLGDTAARSSAIGVRYRSPNPCVRRRRMMSRRSARWRWPIAGSATCCGGKAR